MAFDAKSAKPLDEEEVTEFDPTSAQEAGVEEKPSFIDTLKAKIAARGQMPTPPPSPGPQIGKLPEMGEAFLTGVGQGGYMGRYPDVEAALQTRLGRGEPFDVRKQAIQKRMEELQGKYPKLSLAGEVAGGIIPTAIATTAMATPAGPGAAPLLRTSPLTKKLVLPTLNMVEGLLREKSPALRDKLKSMLLYGGLGAVAEQGIPFLKRRPKLTEKGVGEGNKLWKWYVRKKGGAEKYLSAAQERLFNLLKIKSLRQASDDIAKLVPDFEKQKIIADTIFDETDLTKLSRTTEIINVWKKAKDKIGEEIGDFYKLVDADEDIVFDVDKLMQRTREYVSDQINKGKLDPDKLKLAEKTIKRLQQYAREDPIIYRKTAGVKFSQSLKAEKTHEFLSNLGNSINWKSPDAKQTQRTLKKIRLAVQDELYNLIEKQKGKEYVNEIRSLNEKYNALMPIEKMLKNVDKYTKTVSPGFLGRLRDLVGSSVYRLGYVIKNPQAQVAFEGSSKILDLLSSPKAQILKTGMVYKKYLDAIDWNKVQYGDFVKKTMEDLLSDIGTGSVIRNRSTMAMITYFHNDLYQNNPDYRAEFQKQEKKEERKDKERVDKEPYFQIDPTGISPERKIGIEDIPPHETF